ncbi:MAG: sigma-70 family RNA polymerase sigma factor [Acidobacteriota bacterium]
MQYDGTSALYQARKSVQCSDFRSPAHPNAMLSFLSHRATKLLSRRRPTPTDSMEQRFLAQLPQIERAARAAGRRARFSPEDVEDFVSIVKLHLIEDDYAVLRKHRGDAKLSTYLVTVIHNRCRDHRNHLWGKFRPSAKAKRLGPDAVLLEQLLVRDEHSLDMAISMARMHYDVEQTPADLRALAAQLPIRMKRPRMASDDGVLEMLPAPSDGMADPTQRLEDADRAATVAHVSATLDAAMAAFEPQDRLILKLHFGDGKTMAEVSRLLRVEQRPLYRRRDRCLRALRTRLEHEGLTWDDIREILGWREGEWESSLSSDATRAPSANQNAAP